MNELVIEHRIAIGVAFMVIMGAACVLDFWMVVVRKVPSISWRTWMEMRKHPTLIAAGIIATLGVCFLLQGEWGLVAFAGIMGGHLFVHY